MINWLGPFPGQAIFPIDFVFWGLSNFKIKPFSEDMICPYIRPKLHLIYWSKLPAFGVRKLTCPPRSKKYKMCEERMCFTREIKINDSSISMSSTLTMWINDITECAGISVLLLGSHSLQDLANRYLDRSWFCSDFYTDGVRNLTPINILCVVWPFNSSQFLSERNSELQCKFYFIVSQQ